MAYHREALGVTRDQQKILIDIPVEDLQKIPTVERLNLVLRRQEVRAAESSARWGAITAAVPIAVAVAAFLGIHWVTKKGK